MNKEFSAGGLVRRGGKVLMVKVCNLKGEEVWTFPKGHVEKGETPMEAALREVEEETGWRCRLKEAAWYPSASIGLRWRRLKKAASPTPSRFATFNGRMPRPREISCAIPAI